jgi:hypothetical protein
MASMRELRQRLRGQPIETLCSRIEPLLARSEGDARSDVDLLAAVPLRSSDEAR